MNKVPILQHDFSRRFGDVNSDDASVNSQQFSLHCKHVYHLQAVSGKTVFTIIQTDIKVFNAWKAFLITLQTAKFQRN